MGDVQYHAFLGQKQAVEISIRLGFPTQTNCVLFTHSSNKTFSTAEATPPGARNDLGNCSNGFAIASKSNGRSDFGLVLSRCKNAMNPD